ncbi:MAG: helix-turn-helix domain-containing protein [Flavisolibacter sp.]
MSKILSKEQAAVLLGISTKTLDRRVEKGLISCIQEGKFIRFTQTEIDAYLQRHSQTRSLQTA